MDSSAITVMLVLTLIMPGDKPNITYKEAMPSIEECLRELRIFLNSYPPDNLEANALGAQCVKRLEKSSPTHMSGESKWP